MSTESSVVEKTAVISPDGQYRYALTRNWGNPECHALFIMLNPSTADAELDDPTIRRCMGFARRLHCGGLTVVNLYAYRATDPTDLWRTDDPVGPENDTVIEAALLFAARARTPIIAAWGANAKPDRVEHVRSLPNMARAQALGFTKAGAPRHPLYIKGDAPLVPMVGVR